MTEDKIQTNQSTFFNGGSGNADGNAWNSNGETGNPAWNPGREFWFFIPEEILPLIYADADRLFFLYQKKIRKRNLSILLLMFGIVICMNLVTKVSVFSFLCLIVATAAIWYLAIRKVFGNGQIRIYGQRLKQGRLLKALVGNWQIRIQPDGYEIIHGNLARKVSCKEPKRIFQTDGAYFIFDEEMEKCDIFLKSMFQNPGQRQEWEQQYRQWGWQEKILDQKRVLTLARSRWIAGAVLACAILAYVMEPVFLVFRQIYTSLI